MQIGLSASVLQNSFLNMPGVQNNTYQSIKFKLAASKDAENMGF